jgi:CheY-like chemotaxis protein
MLTKMALRDAEIVHEVAVVGDGERALALLRQQGQYAGAIRPDIVLLDLNLPKINGRQVLAEMRADEALQGIPVIVLSGAVLREDLKRMVEQYATSYLVKPLRLQEYFSITHALKEACDLVAI